MLKKFIYYFALAIFLVCAHFAYAGTGHNTSGWAWSENIGWISFNNTSDGSSINYGVNVDLDTGQLSGFAWSEHIGWITFDRARVEGAGVSPSARLESVSSSVLGKSDVRIIGWALVTSFTGEWDGLIKFDHGRSNSVYIDKDGNWHGWAWGTEPIGWISFNKADTGASSNYLVRTPLSSGPPSGSLTVALTATPSSGTAPLNGVDLTAQPAYSGPATTFNVTYYCNCNNSTTNVNVANNACGMYTVKRDGVSLNQARLPAVDACNYNSAGTYYPKVIVEAGSLAAENRVTVTATSGTTPPPPPPPGTGDFDLSIEADPSSGDAPLNDVALKGYIRNNTVQRMEMLPMPYAFYCDCNSNTTSFTEAKSICGSPIHEGAVSGRFGNYDLDYLANYGVGICDYPDAGTYHPKFIFERGGLVKEARTTVTVGSSEPPTLTATLTANPSSASSAPLNDVDLSTNVGGTQTGSFNVTLYCNCDNPTTSISQANNACGQYSFKQDGISAGSNPYNAVDVCDYSTAGTYTPKVIVERGTLITEDRTTVNIQDGETLAVDLSADPSSGDAPLFDIELTAEVTGSAQGTINYYFYCNCDDPTTDVNPLTSPCGDYDANLKNQEPGAGTGPAMGSVEAWDYLVLGTYTPKVIVERGSLQVEDRTTVNVSGGTIPVASNLSVSSHSPATYCDVPRHDFAWRYTGNSDETKFDFQVDNNSNFSSPEVTRTITGTWSSGDVNTQTMAIENPQGQTYYWRVRVYDSVGNNSGWISGSAFAVAAHSYPDVSFSWSPQTIREDADTTFSDTTSCDGVSCTVWSWTFQNATPASSSSKNPVVRFSSQGQKQVTLNVTDATGYSCPFSSTVTVNKKAPGVEPQ